MLATLRTYQDRVLAIAGEAEVLLREGGIAAAPRIVQLRVDQGVAMAAYQLFVHREIFAPLIRDGAPAEVEAAKQLKVACILFSNHFCHYAQDWSRRDPAAEWASYQPAALALIGELRGHVSQVREMFTAQLGRWEPRPVEELLAAGY